MSLEKLKSVFDDISKFENLNKSIHVGKDKKHQNKHSLLDLDGNPPNKPTDINIPSPKSGKNSVGVQDAPWWTKDTSDWNIDGTPSFDTRSLSDIYLEFSSNQPVVDTQLATAGGGFKFNFNNLFSLAMGNEVGLGDVFSLSNTKLMLSDTSFDASLYYINSGMGDVLALDAKLGQFGKLSEKFNAIGSQFGLPGIKIPGIKLFGQIEDINPFNNRELMYQNQVYELFNNDAPSDVNALEVDSDGSFFGMPQFKNPYRGVAFQVLGKNKIGSTDFTYMSQVENEISLNLISPIAGWRSGDIKFKPIDIDIDLPDITLPKIDLPSLDLPSLDLPWWADLDILKELLPTIELPNWSLPKLSRIDLSGISSGFNTFFEFTDEWITGIWQSIHTNFPNGWGHPIKWPKFKGIKFSPDFSAIGDALKEAGDFLSGVADKVGDAISNVASNISDALSPLSDIAKQIKVSPFNISGGGIKIGNLNPIESLKLPSIKLQNPFDVNMTDFGGKGQLLNNEGPRHPSLSNSIPMRKLSPSETKEEGVLYNKGKLGPYSSIGTKYWNGVNQYYPQLMDARNGGDVHTYTALTKGMPNTDFFKIGNKNVIEDEEFGMPFYFYDLRDNTHITFRAYIEALTEQLSPSWSSENYVGRSEPVYIYERTERSIDFTLKLFAQTGIELDSIYSKMRRLTSLTYPEYKPDWNSAFISNLPKVANVTADQLTAKVRMKPPLCRLRIGELYGRQTTTQEGINLAGNNDVLGFIKSLSYSVPDNSPWEYRKGQRVPKHIVATVGYQVIHDNPPNMHTDFYGYQGSNPEAI